MGLVKRGNVWWMNLIFKGQRIRRSTGSSNRALADSIMAKVKVQLIEGQYFDRAEEKSRTFGELMDRFEQEHLVKLASRATGEVFVKRFRVFFGDRTLAEITPKLIVAYKCRRYATGVKAASINRELTCGSWKTRRRDCSMPVRCGYTSSWCLRFTAGCDWARFCH